MGGLNASSINASAGRPRIARKPEPSILPITCLPHSSGACRSPLPCSVRLFQGWGAAASGPSTVWASAHPRGQNQGLKGPCPQTRPSAGQGGRAPSLEGSLGSPQRRLCSPDCKSRRLQRKQQVPQFQQDGAGGPRVDPEIKGKQEPPRPLVFGLWTEDPGPEVFPPSPPPPPFSPGIRSLHRSGQLLAKPPGGAASAEGEGAPTPDSPRVSCRPPQPGAAFVRVLVFLDPLLHRPVVTAVVDASGCAKTPFPDSEHSFGVRGRDTHMCLACAMQDVAVLPPASVIF